MTKFVAVSDTHTKHWDMKIPEGNVLIHAGDGTWQGQPHEIMDLNSWFRSLRAQGFDEIIFVPGNHDLGFEDMPATCRALLSEATVLIEESVTIDNIKIYGIPHTPRFHDWAFNVDRRSPQMVEIMNRIPIDTDILVTHGPPFGILDQVPEVIMKEGVPVRSWNHVGCEELNRKIFNDLPNMKYHIFGHIHEGAGQEIHQWIPGNVQRFINASQLDGRYQPTMQPHVFEFSK